MRPIIRASERESKTNAGCCCCNGGAASAYFKKVKVKEAITPICNQMKTGKAVYSNDI